VILSAKGRKEHLSAIQYSVCH